LYSNQNIGVKMSNSKGKILWIDDEIEHLRPHIILLEKRGYEVSTASNGEDAIELVKNNSFDLVFLDEMMIGISGLETLTVIKEISPVLPVVMVTKNEAESLMEDAIGRKIDDYLTKPVNPAQILMACKKFLEAEKIETQKITQEYLQSFNEISRKLLDNMDWDEWVSVYQTLVKWSLELDRRSENSLKETLQNQWKDANAEYSKFVERNYFDWINTEKGEENPLLSPNILDNYLLPHLKNNEKVFLFVVDCMRYDQWLLFEEMLYQYYNIDTNFYCAMLPTVTAYCRNALFAGLYPIDIKKHYPQYWNVEEASEDHTLNKFEPELFDTWIERKRIKLKNKVNFVKIFETEFGKKIEKEIQSYYANQLNVIVLNAVDMIAHSRSDYAILKEIAPDESAYRSLTKSWFQHSSFLGMLKQVSQMKDVKVIITTDHGSVRCLKGVKAYGDKDTTTSLRYKFGKNVKTEAKYAMQVNNLNDLKIPTSGMTINNIIAKEDAYFVYPTDYHYYLNKYKDSFQHGGISLEEMIVPVINLTPKK